jgi:hypothetical protein
LLLRSTSDPSGAQLHLALGPDLLDLWVYLFHVLDLELRSKSEKDQ